MYTNLYYVSRIPDCSGDPVEENEEMALSASVSQQTAQSPIMAPTWTIDAVHSSAEFSVKHMVVSTARGRFGALAGTLSLDPERPANGSVTATIDAAAIDTNDERRDAHLRSPDFLDVERHPVIEFRSTAVETLASDHWKVHGQLTIRGVTRPVTLDTHFDGTIRDAYGMTRAAFTATTSVNRKDFGLNWNGLIETGGAIVADTVKIELNIAAVMQE